MKNLTVEIAGAALAIGVVLSSILGVGFKDREGGRHSLKIARAQSIEHPLQTDEKPYNKRDSVDFLPVDNPQEMPLCTNAKAAYVSEAHSGIAVFEKNAKRHLPIASMCKIMTLLLTFEAIDSGVLLYDDEVMISENAASMGGSQVFLEENAKYPVRELIKSIVVCSANDSCVALAERIAGNDSLFVERMNDRAKELGCEDTLFANCTGLPKEPQYSCAKDVAKMLGELIKHDEYFTFGKIWMDKFQHPENRFTEISNTNRLVKFYDGCDGGKTGFTNEAGFCLAATAMRNGMRIISVVIGEPSSKIRFKEVSDSFDYAFANYTMKKVVSAERNLDGIGVSGGKEKRVDVRPQRDGYIFLKRGEKEDCTVEIELGQSLKAPVSKGENAGTLIIYRSGVEYDRIPMVTAACVEKAGYLDALRDVAQDWNFCGR